MQQTVLPFAPVAQTPRDIVLGPANAGVARALAAPANWPFRTAVLHGPPRSGKTLFARWFVASGLGEALDDAPAMAEAEVFHRWNRAQEAGVPLLVVGGQPPWMIALPDLRSRLAAALQLEIGTPDDRMAQDLILSLAAERGLALPRDATDYLVPRAGRSQAELERLVDAINRLCWERKVAPTLGIWRAALEAVQGPEEPRLL